jgi:hypothetical protein
MTIDAVTRMAYVDGELDAISRRRVERAMADDPALAEAIARDRALRKTLQARFAPYAEAPVPDRFAALLDAKIVPITGALRRPKAGLVPRRWMQAAAIAATLVLGIAIGRQTDDSSPVAAHEGALVAQGRLASALDTQLASTQPSDAPIRIGLTFRSTEGSICRTFDGRQLQGIACHDNDRWNLVRAAAGERSGTYRQASSDTLANAAQMMMSGIPFSAAAEASARNKGWQ